MTDRTHTTDARPDPVTRERCPVCDAPLATEADSRSFWDDPGPPIRSRNDPPLCWSRWPNPSGSAAPEHANQPVDWRARALAAEAELARLRARLDVDEQDVDEADIGDICSTEDSPKVIAWMRANGFEFVGHGGDRHPGIWRGEELAHTGSPMASEDVVNNLARTVGRPPLDVLAEMAAMGTEQ